MKTLSFIFLLQILTVTVGLGQKNTQKNANETLASIKTQEISNQNNPYLSSVQFIQNKNQWDESVLYRASIPSGFMFLKKNEIQYSFYDSRYFADHAKKKSPQTLKLMQKGLTCHSFTVTFEGANFIINTQTSEEMPEKYNYFIGNKPEKWANSVSSYQKVAYKDIYKGTDLIIYEKNSLLKYEFVLQAGANPNKIKMNYKHATNVAINAQNELVITTKLGTMTEKQPYCYQIINEKTVFVPSRFKLKDNIVTFDLYEGYNKAHNLVIDPSLVFSSYSGSTSDNWGNTATFDNDGNLYAGGTVFGADFPVTVGVFQNTPRGAGNSSPSGNGSLSTDVGIIKYNGTNGARLYISFFGGNRTELPNSFVVDKDNNLVILGATSSSNLPITAGCLDNSFDGGTNLNFSDGQAVDGMDFTGGADLFIAKINPTGTQILACTYFGGSGVEGINTNTSTFIMNYGDEFRGDIITDATGDIFVGSLTNSTSITGVTGTLSSVYDGLLVKINSNLTAIIWGTYLSGNGFDGIYSVKLNSLGQICVAGGTTSTDLPTTAGVIKPNALNTESDNGFIAKYNASGTFLAGTYIGTNRADQVFFIDIDTQDNIIACGQTFGVYPVTAGVYNNLNGGIFLQKINSNLAIDTNSFSTTIGSPNSNPNNVRPNIVPTAFLVNQCNNIYIAGWGGITNSEKANYTPLAQQPFLGQRTFGLPITADARQSTTSGHNFYFMVLAPRAALLLYGSFFGSGTTTVSDHVDGGTCRFSKDGTVYHSVCSCKERSGGSLPTNTINFPVTTSIPHLSGNCNNAAFKFEFGLKIALDILDGTVSVLTSRKVCSDVVTLKSLTTGADNTKWEVFKASVLIATILQQTTVQFPLQGEGNYLVRLTVSSQASCVQNAVQEETFAVFLPVFTAKADRLNVCTDDNLVNLQATAVNTSGATTYLWEGDINTFLNPSDVNIATPQVRPIQDTTYTVTITDGNCSKKIPVRIKVNPAIVLDIVLLVAKECDLTTSVSFTNKTTGIDTMTWNMGNGTVITGFNPPPYFYGNVAGVYTITITGTNTTTNCSQTITRIVTVGASTEFVSNVITPDEKGKNEKFVLPDGLGKYKLEMFNRWGKKIYTNDDYKGEWGSGLDAGIYYYLITSPSGVECKGFIQVLK